MDSNHRPHAYQAREGRTGNRKSLNGRGFLAADLSGSSGFNRLSFRFFSPNDTQERHPAETHAITQIDECRCSVKSVISGRIGFLHAPPTVRGRTARSQQARGR